MDSRPITICEAYRGLRNEGCGLFVCAFVALIWRLAEVRVSMGAAMSTDLLPCPFCGHVGLTFSDGSTYRWGVASCAGCGASAGETRREYPNTGAWHADAIAEWNTRTPPEPPAIPTGDVQDSSWGEWQEASK